MNILFIKVAFLVLAYYRCKEVKLRRSWVQRIMVTRQVFRVRVLVLTRASEGFELPWYDIMYPQPRLLGLCSAIERRELVYIRIEGYRNIRG